MAELEQGEPVSLEELMVTTRAMADAVIKQELAVYQRILNRTTQ